MDARPDFEAERAIRDALADNRIGEASARWRLATERLREIVSPRAKALIATIFGDALLPLGGGIWLKDLIRLTAPFGLSDRLVRTAVYRLRQENWLLADRRGRESFYRLSESGMRSFLHASARIYHLPDAHWDGRWTLAIIDRALPRERRERLVREAGWAGFAGIGPQVLAHPSSGQAGALRAAIADAGAEDAVIILEARDISTLLPERIGEIASRFWSLDDLAVQYEAFLARFAPVREALADGDEPDGETSFMLRTLLIHDYRRILLKDPALPLALLPQDWPGRHAALTTRDIYCRLAAPSQAFVMERIDLTRLRSTPDASFRQRFGGL